MFHTSQPDRVPGGRVDENLALQFEMPAAGLMGRLKLMNAKGTQRPIVKGEGLGKSHKIIFFMSKNVPSTSPVSRPGNN